MFTGIKFRKWLGLLPAWVSVVLFLGGAGSGPAPAADPPRPGPPGPRLPHDYISLPGAYWMLGRQEVRDEVGLTAEQSEQLKQISRKFADANRQATAGIDWAKLSPEERRKKYGEMMAENKRRTDGFSKQVQDVLTADQKHKFELLDLRQQAMQLLFFTPDAEKLGLTDRQKEKLRKDRDEHHKKMRDLQRRSRSCTIRLPRPPWRC